VLGDEVKELQTRLLELMGTTKTVRVDMEDGTPVNVTVVRGTKVNIDENGLKKALGASMWDKVTTKSLDMKKLQAYIASGEIDPMVVANVSKETAIAPYVTVK
jgi:transcriptional regulator with AAA-type ATPase domain